MEELSPRALSFLLAAILYADEARSAAYRIPSLCDEITRGLRVDAEGAPAGPRPTSADEVLAWLEKKQAL